MKRSIAYTFPLSTGVLLQKIAPKKGPGQKNSSTLSRWPYYQAVGWVQQEKTTGQRPVYLGGVEWSGVYFKANFSNKYISLLRKHETLRMLSFILLVDLLTRVSDSSVRE